MADKPLWHNIVSSQVKESWASFLYTQDLAAVLPQDIIVALGAEIQQLKEAYSKPLMGEFEYDKTEHGFVNTTLFGKVSGAVSQADIDRVIATLHPLQASVQLLLHKIHDAPLDVSMKDIYTKSLRFLDNQYELVRCSIPLEAEKSGYMIDAVLKKDLVQKVDALQTMVYGPSLLESPELFRPIVSAVHKAYAQFADRLSTDEQQEFRDFLDVLPTDGVVGTSPIPSSVTMDDALDEKSLSVDVAADVARRVVELYSHYYTKNYGLPALDWQVVINEKQSAMSVDGLQKKVYIPGAVDKKLGIVPNVSVAKILKILISHEWERHGLSAVNTANVFGDGFSWADYLPTEEWLAKVHEWIAIGAINTPADLVSLSESVSLGQVRNLLCTLYPYDKALRLMTLYLKLKKSSNNPETLVLRGKRTISLDKPGLNRKELSYQKGVQDLIGTLSTQSLDDVVWAYKDMAFKLSLNDAPLVRDLVDKHTIDSNRVVYALFLGRMLFDKILYGKGSARGYTNPLGVAPMDLDDKKRFLDIKRIVASAQ